MHLRRSKVPREWPLARKGSNFVASASHAKKKGLPVLFILREMLKVARTRKEAKKIVFNGDVKINGKIVRNEMFPVQLLDVFTIEKLKKNYRMQIENGKFSLIEVSGKDAQEKIVSICGKRLLGNGNVQMNLEDGRNILTKEKFSVGDSAVVNLENGKIEKILPLKEGAKVEIIGGKHAGEKGELKEIESLARSKRYAIKLNDKEVGIPLDAFMVIK